MKVTRTWKIYGVDGHRQRESFGKSFEFENKDRNVRVAVMNSDKTGTNEYSIIRIDAESNEACLKELEGQLSDGVFENSRYGRVEEVVFQ